MNTGMATSVFYCLGTVFTDTVWQGLLIGITLFASLALLKSTDAKSRYAITALALVAFLIWTGFDFYRVLNQSISFIRQAGNIQSLFQSDGKATNPLWAGITDNYSGNGLGKYYYSFYSWSARYYIIIAPIWILGILVLSIRMAGGLIYANRLKKGYTYALPSVWVSCLEDLIRKLDLHIKVMIRGSYKVTSLLVIGFIKPVILVPVDVISGMSYAQVEAVLAHELAHIRRNDFLFILLQNLTEILLFYHPLTWFISSTLNKERERCCDDIAVSLCNGSLSYAKAIAAMENIKIQNNFPAASLLGRSNSLFHRIRRILENTVKRSTLAEKLAACMMALAGLFCLFAFAGFTGFAHTHNNPEGTANNPLPAGLTVPVSLPDTISHIRESRTIEAQIKDDSGKYINNYKITIEKDSLKELYIDGKKIEKDQLGDYMNRIDAIKEEAKKSQRGESYGNFPFYWKQDSHLNAEIARAMEKSQKALEKLNQELRENQKNLMYDYYNDSFWKNSDAWRNNVEASGEASLKAMEEMQKRDTVYHHGKSYGHYWPDYNPEYWESLRKSLEIDPKLMKEQFEKFREGYLKDNKSWIDSLNRQMDKFRREWPKTLNKFDFYWNAGPGEIFDHYYFDMFNPDMKVDTKKSAPPNMKKMEDRLKDLEK